MRRRPSREDEAVTALAAQLNAEVGLQYDPSWVRYQLTAPLAALGKSVRGDLADTYCP